ncbi:MAG: efflux RND transporter periplasmic adaptor subunit [Bacteroidales bacterium]|nr:efflux RND transporter periplasmic adaptor subunit [Bacteroidales bacterium]MDD4669907.1 efflux RND transporter periplasmic adaptor subunit [Bacteroidales bacterium]
MGKRKFKIKTWQIAIAVLIVIIAIIALTGKKPSSAEVTVEQVSVTDIIESIPASGKIQPVIEVKISPDVSGEIIDLYFEEGQSIKKGDLIMKIKQDVYISMVERAEASLNTIKAQYLQQKAQMIQAELSYKRNKSLYGQKAISDADFESAQANYEIAKEQLKAAEYNIKSGEASVKEARENLTKTFIYSPMDGIISKMSIEKGERVVGTSQMAGTEMLRIADFSKMEVLVDVNENDIIRIHPGDTANIEVDAYPSRQFVGIVTQIANSAKNIGLSVDQVTNFEVKIAILPESYNEILEQNTIPFRPGMSASVSIVTSRKNGIITIPIQSIFSKDKKEYVWVIREDNTVTQTEITTGVQDLNSIEIVSGLSKNDKVVVSPYSAITKTLTEGQKIKKAVNSSQEKEKETKNE